MSVEALSLAQARAGHRLLLQYLVPCPGCGKSGAAHADEDAAGVRTLIRFVCPEACAVGAAEVLTRLPVGQQPIEVA